METKRIVNLEKRVLRVERDLKRVKEVLELASPVNPFNWNEFSELDKRVIALLLQRGLGRGMATTELAQALGFENLNSGRVIMWRRLKQIAKKSKARTGYPLVVYENRSWHMNFTDFTFVSPKEVVCEKNGE